MSTDNTITKTDLKNILEEIGNIGGSGDATPTPTANATAGFDLNAHMNSEDMTAQEVEDFVGGLNVSGVTAVDYIVEQGTDGIWTYRKWNSGVAECWGTYTSSNISVASRNGWYSGECTPDNFPTGLFNSVPKVSTNCTIWGTGYHFSFAYNVTSSGCKVGGIRNDLVSSPMTVDIFATGTWK